MRGDDRGGSINQGDIPEKRQRHCPKCGAYPGMFCRSLKSGPLGRKVMKTEHRER